jgi:hypothetical protein
MRKPQGTCKGCQERYVGCHSECEKYKEYKRQLALWRVELQKKNGAEWVADTRPWMHRKK